MNKGGDVVPLPEVADALAGRIVFIERNASITLPGIHVEELELRLNEYPDAELYIYASQVSLEPIASNNITIYVATYAAKCLAIRGSGSGQVEELLVVASGDKGPDNMTYIQVVSDNGWIMLVPRIIVYYTNSSGPNGYSHTINVYVPVFKGITLNGEEKSSVTVSGVYNVIVIQHIEKVTVLPVEKKWIAGDTRIYANVRINDIVDEKPLGVVGDGDTIYVYVNVYRLNIYVSLETVG